MPLATIPMTPSAATPQNVALQPKACPMKVPSGTPVTVATVRPVNMKAGEDLGESEIHGKNKEEIDRHSADAHCPAVEESVFQSLLGHFHGYGPHRKSEDVFDPVDEAIHPAC